MATGLRQRRCGTQQTKGGGRTAGRRALHRFVRLPVIGEVPGLEAWALRQACGDQIFHEHAAERAGGFDVKVVGRPPDPVAGCQCEKPPSGAGLGNDLGPG
jgi:hypothetical protein